MCCAWLGQRSIKNKPPFGGCGVFEDIIVDFASLTSDQKQSVICARAIEQYAHSILNSATSLKNHSEFSALVKLYSCFLIVDDIAFHRSEDTRYQCLAQLAGTFDDYSKYSSEITDTVNKYLASWNARRIRFANDPNATANIETLSVLMDIVADDLYHDHYLVDPLFISKCTTQYCKDFSARNSSVTSDDQYLSELNQVLDELEAAVPNSVIWKTFRRVLVENFKRYFDQYFPDPSSYPSPQQYAVEYILIMCIDSIDKEPFIDTAHNLTDAGNCLRDFAWGLGDYSVQKEYITYESWSDLRTRLLKKTSTVRTESSKTATQTSDSEVFPVSSIILIIILTVAICIIFAFGGSSDSPAPPKSSAVASSTSFLPVPKPETGVLYDVSYDDSLAPFTIDANNDTDYVLRLCDGKEIIQSYYIRAGETLSVHVPLGEYSLYYACAPRDASWFGEDFLWGAATSYYKSSGSYEFDFDGEYYNGYTLNLLSWSDSSGNTKAVDSYSNVWDSLY